MNNKILPIEMNGTAQQVEPFMIKLHHQTMNKSLEQMQRKIHHAFNRTLVDQNRIDLSLLIIACLMTVVYLKYKFEHESL